MVMMSINNSDAFRRRVAILLVFTQGILVAQQTAHAFVPPLLRRAVPVPVTIHETRSRRFSIKPDKEQTEIVNVDTDIERDPIRSFIPFPIDNEIEIKNVDKDEQQKQLGIWAARGLLLLVAMLWGTNFASVKYLETLCFHPPCNHPPSQAAFARFGVAALVSLPLLIGQRKDIILAGFECGLWITLGYITQAMALEFIPSGKCAFICSLTVVTVPLIAYLIGGKPIKSIEVASAIVALTGVGVLEGVVDVNEILGIQPTLADTSTVLVSLASTGSTATSGVLGTLAQSIGVSKGDLLALGQPLGFGLSFMRIEHYVEKFKDVPNRVLTISAAQCMAVGLCSLLWLLYDFHGTIPNFTYMVRRAVLKIHM